MSVTFNFVNEMPEGISKQDLLKVAKETIGQAKCSLDGEINIGFVDKKMSRRLNNKYAGNDYATDVLSFDYEAASIDDEKQLGDIVICIPIAKDQANEANISLFDELSTLCAHGILHVIGYDHQSQSEQASFTKLQNGIVRKMGIKTRAITWLH